MEEKPEEVFKPVPEKISGKKQPTPQDYKELAVLFGGLPEMTRSEDPYGAILELEEVLEKRFEGAPFGERLDSLLPVATFLHFLEFEVLVRGQEEMKDRVIEESIAMQRKVAEYIYSNRNEEEILKLFSPQMEFLVAALETNYELRLCNRGLLNGVNGMVATMIALHEQGFEIGFPEDTAWDRYHNIDLLARDKKGKVIGVGIECRVDQKSLNVSPVDFGEKEEWIKRSFGPGEREKRLKEWQEIKENLDGVINVWIPAPRTREDLWQNPLLGLPGKDLIRTFAQFKPGSQD